MQSTTSSKEPFLLIPGALNLDRIRSFQSVPCTVQVEGEVYRTIARGHAVLERRIDEKIPTYGVNTGFGSMSDRSIDSADVAELQRRLILSNAAGTGAALADDVVRCVMLLKLNALATGLSGVRVEMFEALRAMLNAGIVPVVPAQGSVGASGDLAPLAHIGAALIGVGTVRYCGETMPAGEALTRAGLTPFTLAAKEGLAIVNGTQVSAALALNGLLATEDILSAAIVAGALSVEAALGQDLAFDARLHEARGQVGQCLVASAIRDLLTASEIRERAQREGRLQDPYCLRCQPQVIGACHDQMVHAAHILVREANAWTDNPMITLDSGEILYGGNFHAEPVGFAADNLAIAIAEIAAMSERRIALLTDANHSKLPAFLVEGSGLDSGFMVAHVTAAALVSENKSLAHPAVVDSIPTTANFEDFVSMATFAARRLEDMARNAATVIAIELLAACQGLEFRRPARPSPALERACDLIRQLVPPLDTDRFLAPEIQSVSHLVRQGAFLEFLPDNLRLASTQQSGVQP